MGTGEHELADADHSDGEVVAECGIAERCAAERCAAEL
jgi:hypothetical protein